MNKQTTKGQKELVSKAASKSIFILGLFLLILKLFTV